MESNKTESQPDPFVPAPVEKEVDGPLTLASIAVLLEENRKAISADFTEKLAKLESKLNGINDTLCEHSEKIESLEKCSTEKSARLSSLEDSLAALQASNAKLASKVVDLEARSRRNNIRVIGIPESVEDLEQPTIYFSKLLAGVFPDILNSPPECDRAHRIAISQLGQKPRPVIIRLLKFQDKDKIIRAARASRGKLTFHSHPISIYEDYPQEIVEQRKKYSEVMSQLFKKGLKPSLLYPSRLHIKTKEGGRLSLPSVSEAEQYLLTIT